MDGRPLTDLERLRNAVARELHAQLPLRGEKIVLADVPEVAYAVAVQLKREFRIEGGFAEPEEAADDEAFGLDGAAFHGSTLPAGERYPIFDHGWPAHR